MVRLLTITDLKTDGFVNNNLEEEYLYSALDEAQDIFLREILGDSLYESIQNMVNSEDVQGDYRTLLDSYIKIYLKYKVLSLLCIPLTFKLRNAGVVSQYSPEINTTSLEDTKYMQNYYEGKADFYANRLTKYLECGNFPEYRCTCNDITSPNPTHPVCTIYLGN